MPARMAAVCIVLLHRMPRLTSNAGGRTVCCVLTATVLGFVPVLLWLMRDRPEDLGLVPYGATQADPPAPPAGNPITAAFRGLSEGARSRDFWLLAGSYFVCGASTNGLISTHLIPACVDPGLTEVAGASLLATTGLFAFLGGTASGWLSDRWDNRFLLFWYYGLRGLSLMYLPFAFDMSFYGLSLFSIFYGLDWIATGPPTVRLLVRAIGVERIGIMVSWITALHRV